MSAVRKNESRLLRFVRRTLQAPDLPEVNRVIQASIESWPTTARLKRLAMSPLRYRDADLQDFEFVLCYKAHACLGIAAWQPDNSLVFQKSESFAEREENWAAAEAVLLHGLFVSAKAQGRGIGSLLLDELTRLARQKRFAGIFVRAERFSTGFFEQKGFRLLRGGDQPGLHPANYPHRYLMEISGCASK